MGWEIGGDAASAGELATMRTDLGVAGKQALWIPAGAMLPTISNGCTGLATTELAAGKPDLTYLSFSGTVDQYAQFSIAMPSRWNESTVTFKAHWHHPDSSTNSVVWQLEAMSFGDNDNLSVAFNASGTSQKVTDAATTNVNYLRISSESSAITVGGTPQTEDEVDFRIGRLASSDANDTLTTAARLKGITLYWTSDTGVDTA